MSILLASGCGASGVASVSTTNTPARTSNSAATLEAHPDPDPDPSSSYKVLSGSMEPTLPIRAMVDVGNGPLTVGAIVVYHPPKGFAAMECGPRPHIIKPGGAACDAPIPEKARIKLITRIVAGPGDEIYVREGHVYRKTGGSDKFVREMDPYIRACGSSPECNFPIPIKIPAGHWFLMGDNRGESYDSRVWGPVPTAWIVGVAGTVYKPKF